MDMLERRIRDAVATLLSRGAKALERTANELEHAADELRTQQERRGEDAEQVWAEPQRETDTAVRGAPLRAVPDGPTAARPTTGSRPVPPVKPPRAPERPGAGNVAAATGTEAEAVSSLIDPEPEQLRALAGGTVSEIRAALPELSSDELRALRDIETANRNRTTLLSAIDRALDEEQ